MNLISELQEQMCRIRQEISNKIQEKPAEIVTDEGCGSEPAHATLTEPKPAVGLRPWHIKHCETVVTVE